MMHTHSINWGPVPKHWRVVQRLKDRVVYEDGGVSGEGQGESGGGSVMISQPCGSCGKGAGPGSGPEEIEAMLRGELNH